MTQAIIMQTWWSLCVKSLSVHYCSCCKIAKAHYISPDTQQGSLVANNLKDLLCINFTMLDPSKEGKVDVPFLIDVFSKFSQAFVIPNKKAITIMQLFMDKWIFLHVEY